MTLLNSINRTVELQFVFPAETGDGHYQGTKRLWPKVIAKADLPGVTPHTLRHTMGSTAVSTGEALALTGAILGHANARSTALMLMCRTTPQGAPQIASPTGSRRRWPATRPPDGWLDRKSNPSSKIRTVGVRPVLSRQSRRTTGYARGRRFRTLPRLGSRVRIASPAPVLFRTIGHIEQSDLKADCLQCWPSGSM